MMEFWKKTKKLKQSRLVNESFASSDYLVRDFFRNNFFANENDNTLSGKIVRECFSFCYIIFVKKLKK